MNRKVFKKWTALAVATVAALAFFIGCANSVGSSSDGTVTGDGAATRMLTISAGNSSSSRYARTMLPVVASDLTGYTVRLTGTSARGTHVTDGTNEYIDLTSSLQAAGATAMVELAATYWELTLTAYNTAGDAVLVGHENVDLTNGVQTITFIMSAGNLTTPGTVKIAGTYVFHEGVAKYSVGLYSRSTGIAVTGYEESDNAVPAPAPADGATADFSFDKSAGMTCPPGEYDFVFKLLDSNDRVLARYTDLIIVDPGVCTTVSPLAIPDLFVAPVKPSNFVAEWVEASASQTDTDNFYKVRFSWADNSTNETHFVIRLAEYDTAGTEIAHQTFPVADSDETASPVSTSLARLVSGSLNANSTATDSCVLELPTGRLFDAKIQAVAARNGVNYPSASVERVNVVSANDGYKGYAADKKINLVHRTYNLSEGTLSLASATDAATLVTGMYHQFKIYEGTNIPVLAIGTNATDNQLVKTVGSNNYPFKHWKNAAGVVVDATNAPVGCVDATFTAVFNTESTIGFEIPGYTRYELAAAKVSVTSTPATAVTGTPADDTVTVANSASGLTVTIDDAEHTYQSYQFYLDGELIGNGAENSVTINPSELGAGNYQFTAIGIRNSSEAYSCPFMIAIESGR